MKLRGEMSVKCAKSGKTVYPGDPQINLDGKIFLKSKAKCEDCGSKLTVTNYHMSKNGDDTWLLLCQTHYKARFSKTGVYAGADKFAKKTGQEVIAADRDAAASSGGNTTPSKVIKSTIWSPQGAVQASDTDYTLERSVTTPDRRPSLRASVGAGMANAAAAERRQSSSGVALLQERRNSLKTVESKANEEISETARRSSIGISSTSAAAAAATTTATTSSVPTDACACDPCNCDPCECSKEKCACTDCKCEDCQCGAKEEDGDCCSTKEGDSDCCSTKEKEGDKDESVPVAEDSTEKEAAKVEAS